MYDYFVVVVVVYFAFDSLKQFNDNFFIVHGVICEITFQICIYRFFIYSLSLPLLLTRVPVRWQLTKPE